MTLLLDDADVRRAIDVAQVIEGLEKCFAEQAAGKASDPERLNVAYDGSWMRLMPAVVPSLGIMGFKAYHGHPGYGARFLVVISSMHNGQILAAMDGVYLTAIRTAATSAVAAKHLAPREPWRMAILGSGLEAEAHCRAMKLVNDMRDIRVFSPNAARCSAFAVRMTSELGLPVSACDAPVEAVRGAHHVLLATNTGPSRSIAYERRWLERGQHLTSIGSTNQRLRELDADVFGVVDTLVFDVKPVQAAKESADVSEYRLRGGNVDRARWLPEIILRKCVVRERPLATTLFKSVGSGVEDIVAAAQVYQAALKRGIGRKVSDLADLKSSSSAAKGQ